MDSADLRRRVRTLAAEWAPFRWLVRGAARVVAPRHHVGAVGVVFNRDGHVLLVEHSFRTDFPWGLPGGWVERGEEPSAAVTRELREELRLDVEVRDLVLCRVVDRVRTSTHPVHLGLAYYCELKSGTGDLSIETLGFEWADPSTLPRALAPFQQAAIARACRVRMETSAATSPTPPA